MIDKLTPYLAQIIISDAEKRVIELSTEVQKLEPQVKDYQQAYLKLQFQYDTAKEKLAQEKELVEWISKQTNKIPQHKKIRVMRATSHNDMKESEKQRIRGKQRTDFRWTTYAVEVLREKNVMLSEDDLWNAMCDKYNVIETLKSLDIGVGKTKYGAIKTCIGKNAEATKEGSTRGVVFEYKGYFGLKEWSTDDFRPKGMYAAIFHKKIV